MKLEYEAFNGYSNNKRGHLNVDIRHAPSFFILPHIPQCILNSSLGQSMGSPMHGRGGWPALLTGPSPSKCSLDKILENGLILMLRSSIAATCSLPGQRRSQMKHHSPESTQPLSPHFRHGLMLSKPCGSFWLPRVDHVSTPPDSSIQAH